MSMNLFNKKAVVGLDDYFARTINNIFQKDFAGEVPGGVIEVLSGAYDEIGSSCESFKRTLQLVFKAFSNYDKLDRASMEEEILSKDDYYRA